MSEHAWLKQVLADAKAAKESWPAWAQNSSVTALNSHPNKEADSIAIRVPSRPAAVKRGNQNDLGLK
jgi:hypothetical protein